MTEQDYAAFVADQRKQGREHVHQLCRDLRRQVFGKFPDPIDRENHARIEARFGDLTTAMKRMTAAMVPMRFTFEKSFKDEMGQWRAEQHIALSVLPNLSRVGLITSPV